MEAVDNKTVLTAWNCWQSFNVGGFCEQNIVIIAFFENATIEYSSKSLCVSLCLCACVCVFLHNNSKRNLFRNMKLEYLVVYVNSSDEFNIEQGWIKVKVTVCLQKFSPFITVQTVRSYNPTLVQARKLIIKHVCSSDSNIQNLQILSCLNDFTNS